MDLLFATISKSTIPENIDLQDPNIIKNTDDKSVLSLNGIDLTNKSNFIDLQ
jgi:poly(A) polymerase Pap1